MTPKLPLALHYEVPDRAAPWAQPFTARLEAIARAARVPLVPERGPCLPALPDGAVRIALTSESSEKTETTETTLEKTAVSYPGLPATASATLGALHLTPTPGPAAERALALTDLAALLIDVARSGPDAAEHPLTRLPPGLYQATLEARSELVPDLTGALTRHTLSQLAERLRELLRASRPASDRAPLIAAELGRRAPVPVTPSTPSSPSTTSTTSSPASAAHDPEHALVTLAQAHQASTRRALSDLNHHVEHTLTTHGLAALAPLLEHLSRLEQDSRDPRQRPLSQTPTRPVDSAELELEAAKKALARAEDALARLAPPLPRQLALVGVHAPVVTTFGALAIAPLFTSALPGLDHAALGPHAAAGLAALALFSLGATLVHASQRLATGKAQRRLERAQHDLELARQHRVAAHLARHAERLEAAATRRHLDGLAELRNRLEPIARKVTSLAHAHPRSTAPDPLVLALAPPIEPWLQAISNELAHGAYQPPTLLALEEHVAAAIAERSRWQSRADVCAALEGPATAELATLVDRLATRLPRSAPARRFAFFPRALTLRGHPDAFTGFELAPSTAGLFALAVSPLAAPSQGGLP